MSHPNIAADAAMRAVDAGTDQQYKTSEPVDGLMTDLSDLLANVRHLCDRHGLDYGYVDSRAHRSYLGDLSEHRAIAERRELPS